MSCSFAPLIVTYMAVNDGAFCSCPMTHHSLKYIVLGLF